MADFRPIGHVLEGVLDRMTETDPDERRRLDLAEARTALQYAELKWAAEPNEPVRRAEYQAARDRVLELMRMPVRR